MAFKVLPAVDVAGGRAVRLVRGVAGTEIVVGSPIEVALAWQAGGARWVHLVDVDAAFGRGSNAETLAAVAGALDVPVELAGGIRDDASLERALSTGCARAVIATDAVADRVWCEAALARHGDRVVVALDVRVEPGAGDVVRHVLAPRGGADEQGGLWGAIAALDRAGCARYVVTDVARDGALGGANLALYRDVTAATSARVVASGGIATLDDLAALARLAASATNLEGAVVGGALHAGRFTLPEALAAVR